MTSTTILMSNLGYLRGINGQLLSHVLYAHRHIYTSLASQKKALRQLGEIIRQQDPDICCFIEIDKGSSSSANFNQLSGLINEQYPFFDIENKYAPASHLRNRAYSKGKSNAFISKRETAFEKIYFTHGIKRLVYKLGLPGGITLFFAHLSLKKAVRKLQLLQIGQLLKETPGEKLFMGDFNILTGMQEIHPLLQAGEFILLNDTGIPTFKFHRSFKMLDLCICSASLLSRAQLSIISQPFSDHEALLLKISG